MYIPEGTTRAGEYGQPTLRTTLVHCPVLSETGTVIVGGMRTDVPANFDATYAASGTTPNAGPLVVVNPSVTARLRAENYDVVSSDNPEQKANQAIVTVVNTGATPFSFSLDETDVPGVNGARTQLAHFSLVPRGRSVAHITTARRYLEVRGQNGGGQLRMEISSLVRFRELAFAKDDPTAAPQLTAGSASFAPFNSLDATAESYSSSQQPH